MFLTAKDGIAIVTANDEISFSDLYKHIRYFSNLYKPEQTTKIAIYAENTPEWIYAFYSGWINDCIIIPIDFMATPDEVAYIINDCEPEFVFYSDETKENFKIIKTKLNKEVNEFNFNQAEYNVEELSPVEFRDVEINETAVIIYTSGTTGSPKGVMLSYDNLLANIEAVYKDIPIYTTERRTLILLPLHHIFPLLGTFIAPLMVGGKVAISPSMNSEDILGTLQNNKINIIIGVPRLYAAIRKGVMDKINSSFAAKTLFKLARKINSRSFSKKLFKKVHEKFGGEVEFMVCGGAKLDEDVAADYKTLGFEMLEGFGMTEAAPMITFTRPGRWRIGSAGEAMPCLEVTSKDGELVARGRNIMKGYYGRPEETAEVIKDGWLHTGDLGHLDEDGFVHVTGRCKEIIVLSNGKNINPEEIENKICNGTKVIAEMGVFMFNDMLHAAIFPDFKKVSEEGILNLDEKIRWDVIDKYNQAASSYKKISKFFLIKEELPKTRLGKIQRFKLADLSATVSQKQKENVKEPEHEEYIIIRDFLSDQTKSPVYPDDHIEIDLGLDSLDKVSLIAFLESTFGIEIKEDVLLNNSTIEKLSLYMKEKKSKLTVEAFKWAEVFKEKIDFKIQRNWVTFNIFKNFSKPILKSYFRLNAFGKEHIPDGPCIIAPNHQSYFDGLFISIYLKNKTMKNTYFYAKEKHVRFGWLKSLAKRNNLIVMDLNKDLKGSLQNLAEVLNKGKKIVIFPEGTRTKTGELGSFKKSFAILSRELNVPVVPVSIKGAYDALPRGTFFPKPWKRVEVKFHKPVYPEGKDYDSIIDNVFKQLASELS